MRTELRFRLVGGDQPLIVIPARFNGSEPILCALDTGASHAVLLPEIGAQLGVRVESSRQARGAAGPISVQVGKVDSIAIGDVVVRDVAVLLTDELRRIGKAIGLPLGGNIGFSALQSFRVTIDYAAGLIALATADEPAPLAPARAELPFTLAHPSKPLIVVPVRIDQRSYSFALDTGASTTVISPAVARAGEIESGTSSPMTGGGGVIAASSGVLSTLTIGSARISRVRVAVADFLDALSQVTGARLDGIVGTNVLRRFRVTIDYPGRIVRLE